MQHAAVPQTRAFRPLRGDCLIFTLLLGATCPLSGSRGAEAQDFGDLVFVGDSLTQGGNVGGYIGPSYRYQLWKHAIDNGAMYTPVGSITGAYQSVTPFTPTHKSQSFVNVHEGHFGWRAFWSNGRIPLPAGRYNTNNLGQGTVENWTGQSTTFVTEDAPTTKTYTGTTYVPDTVVLKMGINDLAETGALPTTTESDLQQIVEQYQAANPNVRVYVASVLPVSNNHASAATINPKVITLNTALSLSAAGWSTGNSTVSYIDVRNGFDATTMTTDNTHLNYAGERIVASNFATGLGIGARDNTIGLATREAPDLATEFNEMNALPDTTPGAPLFRVGTGWSDPVPGDSLITLNEPSGGAASFLRSDWALDASEAYTIETRLQMVLDPTAAHDFVMWSDDGAGGAAAGFLRIYEDKTEWGFASGGRLVLDVNSNTDAFHDFRVSFNGSTYAVWRDGLLIADGLAGDASTSAQDWLVLGNFTGGESTHALVDYVGIETGVAYAVPEPSSVAMAACGAGALLMQRWRRRRRLPT